MNAFIHVMENCHLMSLSLVYDIFIQFHRAVSSCHQLGIAHRNLNPEVISFNFNPSNPSQFHLILGHFENAIDLDHLQKYSQNHTSYDWVATAGYIPPEMITMYTNASNLVPYDPYPLDIWSMGCVLLYTLLTPHSFQSLRDIQAPLVKDPISSPPIDTLHRMVKTINQILRKPLNNYRSGIVASRDFPTEMKIGKLLEGMLCMNPTHRSTVGQIKSILDQQIHLPSSLRGNILVNGMEFTTLQDVTMNGYPSVSSMHMSSCHQSSSQSQSPKVSPMPPVAINQTSPQKHSRRILLPHLPTIIPDLRMGDETSRKATDDNGHHHEVSTILETSRDHVDNQDDQMSLPPHSSRISSDLKIYPEQMFITRSMIHVHGSNNQPQPSLTRTCPPVPLPALSSSARPNEKDGQHMCMAQRIRRIGMYWKNRITVRSRIQP